MSTSDMVWRIGSANGSGKTRSLFKTETSTLPEIAFSLNEKESWLTTFTGEPDLSWFVCEMGIISAYQTLVNND